MTEKHNSVVLEKSVNEVRYWLKENQKEMDEDRIVKVAEKAITLFVEKDYSSLEAAVDTIMSSPRIRKSLERTKTGKVEKE